MKIIWKALAYFILIFFALCILLPFILLFISSFKNAQELFRGGMNLHINADLFEMSNYKALFSGDTLYFRWYLNSILILVIQVPLALILSSIVAFGMAMYEFRFKNLVFLCILIAMMTPFEIIMLPLYKTISMMGLFDTYVGVILPFAVSPFAAFFFLQYLKGIPKDLIEAARMDGCSEFRIYLNIIAPIMRPSFAAMGIFTAIGVWNNFLWPLLVLISSDKQPLPIGLSTLLTPYGNNYQVLMAGSVLAILPVLIVFLFFQKQIISGMTSGSVK